MLVHKCKDKIKISLQNQSLKIRPQNPKVDLFIKPKVKAKRWSAKERSFKSSKEVSKRVPNHPPIFLFISNIALF